jgi:tripeptide aminopeptidase
VAATLLTSSLFLTAFSSAENRKNGKESEAGYTFSSEMSSIYEKLLSNENVQKGLTFIKIDDANTLVNQIEITEIPSPPYKEQKRAEYYKQRLEEIGLQDVQMDEEGNVYGFRKGTGFFLHNRIFSLLFHFRLDDELRFMLSLRSGLQFHSFSTLLSGMKSS